MIQAACTFLSCWKPNTAPMPPSTVEPTAAKLKPPPLLLLLLLLLAGV